MPDTHSDFLKLLRDSFDESELREICFHLNIDYESLRGQGKKEKTLSLLEYCFRTKREQELVTICRKLRPKHEWPELTKKAVNSNSLEASSNQDIRSNKLRTKWLALPVWAWGIVLMGIIFISLIAINFKNINSFSPTPYPTSIYSPNLETITIDNADGLEDLEQLGAWFSNSAISYSPDGKHIAVSTMRGVYLYDTLHMTTTQYIPTNDWVSTIDFSPSGKYLAYSVDGKLQIHNLLSENQGTPLSNESIDTVDSVSQLIFTSDNILIIGSNKEVNFWQSENNTFLQPITTTSKVTKIAFSTDLELLAIGNDDGAVQIWFVGQCLQNQNVTCSQLNTPLSKFESPITGLAFLPDERLLAVSAKESPDINLWNFSNCTQEKSICGQSFGTGLLSLSDKNKTTLTSLGFSSDGQLLAAGSSSGYLEFWNVDIEQSEWQTNTVDLHGGAITELEFSPGNQILATEETNGAIRFLSLEDSNLLNAIYDHVWIDDMTLSHDGIFILTGSWANVVRLLSLEEKEYIQTWGETNGIVEAVALSYDNHFAAAAHSGDDVWIWLVGSNEPTSHIGQDIGTITSIAFSPTEEKLVAGAESGKWYLWNNFSNEADYLLPSGESTITTPISSIAFSSNGKIIATGHQDGSIQLWNAENGKLLSDKIEAHTEKITSIAFSSNEEWLASGTDDGNVMIWTMHDNKLEDPQTLTVHEDAITSLSFSPDSLLLASASQDNTLRIWQVENGAPLGVYRHEYADIHGVAFSVDGTFIVSAGSDGMIHIWGKERE